MTQNFQVRLSMNQAAVVKSGLVLKQGDFGMNLEIEVLNFDTSNTTPQIVFRKPMGAVESTSVTKAGNVYTYTLRGTELDTPGKVICDLKLKNSTTQRISSASFSFEVIADTLDGLAEQASSYSDTIEQISDNLTREVGYAKTASGIVYFTGNKRPTFTWNPNNITIKFPTECNMVLSNPSAGNQYIFACTGQEYTVNGAAQLRYNIQDGNIYILGNDYVDSKTVILVAVSKEGISGLLAPFYCEQRMDETDAELSNTEISVARKFDTNTAYKAGQMVWKDQRLKIFKADHSAGAWNDSEVATRLLSDVVRMHIPKNVYFIGNKAPAFSWNSARTQLSISFEAGMVMNIFDAPSGTTYTKTFANAVTYTLNGAARLSFYTPDGSIYNQANDYIDPDTLILIAVSQKGISGLLAPFYYEQMISEAYLKGQAYAYFSGPSTPTFAIAGDKTSLIITMPDNAALRIYTNRGLQITKAVNGESYTLNRAGGRLVYDVTDDTIKNILNPADSQGNAILLLSFNWFGCSGLLANYVTNILNFDYKEDIYPVVWKRVGGTILKDDFSCIFLTDIHAQAKRAKIAMDFSNAIQDAPLSCVVNGGDTVALHQEDGIAWWNTLVDSSNYPVLSAVGNHDAAISDVQQATAKQTYDLITAKVANTANITQPENASTYGYNYYYKDFNSKVRVIVIDPIFWDSTEKNWFESTLNDAKTNNLAIICVTHYPFNSEIMSFPTIKRNYDASFGDNSYTPEDAANAVKDFIDNDGTFICWMCGHTHTDGFGVLENYGHQVVIMSTTQRFGPDASPAKSNDPRDKNYTAFDVIGVDLDSKLIKMTRIGAHIDWHNISHIKLTYNYQTRTIIEG